jgi:hypothetical protein
MVEIVNLHYGLLAKIARKPAAYAGRTPGFDAPIQEGR